VDHQRLEKALKKWKINNNNILMMKTKLVIAGIGGVGGYFGGLLAKHFCNSEKAEIYFVARGEHLKQIQTNGLTVIKDKETFIAKPALATDNPEDIGIADVIIVCTKSYDLETTIKQLSPCVNKETVILPLLNGVDSRERIKNFLPANTVLDGCVYIVSRLKQAGVIENQGTIQKLYFGLDGVTNEKLTLLENLFREATIEASASQYISTIIWEKFIFISPTATATSYFDKTIGEILADTEKLNLLKALIEEVKLLAHAKRIPFAEDITEKTLTRLKSLPFETTSSMHTDYLNHKPVTELQSLTGFVVEEGKKNKLLMPGYDQVYSKLKDKQYSNAIGQR
jgi:2-dehydropantoate 2-reductase